MKDRILNIVAFGILSLLWLGFIAALVVRPESLNGAWISLRALPLVIQVLAWVLALPVVLGLWIWQTSWPGILRLVLVLGLALATVYTFFPKKTAAKPDAVTTRLG